MNKTAGSEEEWFNFQRNSPPTLKEKFIPEAKQKLDEFIKQLDGKNTRVACVCAGGTAVPLEKRSVRYIENFSKGTRGARSCEAFLEEGYAVIMITRDNAEKPFVNLVEQTTWLDLMHAQDVAKVKDEVEPSVRAILLRYQEAMSSHRLLILEYTTIFEYMELLHLASNALRDFGSRLLLYQAAAVSDFYIPWGSLADHKIQSREGPLSLELQQVPKMLGVVRQVWAPSAFHISFKLETDERLLLNKASASLRKYGHHMVVANELLTRKEKVTLVSKVDKSDAPQLHVLTNHSKCCYIEEPLVKQIAQEHHKFIQMQM